MTAYHDALKRSDAINNSVPNFKPIKGPFCNYYKNEVLETVSKRYRKHLACCTREAAKSDYNKTKVYNLITREELSC